MFLEIILIYRIYYDILMVIKERRTKMNECEKMNCGYYYKDKYDDFPCCHFEGWTAPCEYEDDYEEEE